MNVAIIYEDLILMCDLILFNFIFSRFLWISV